MYARNASHVQMRIPDRELIGVPVVRHNLVPSAIQIFREEITVLPSLRLELSKLCRMWANTEDLGDRNGKSSA